MTANCFNYRYENEESTCVYQNNNDWRQNCFNYRYENEESTCVYQIIMIDGKLFQLSLWKWRINMCLSNNNDWRQTVSTIVMKMVKKNEEKNNPWKLQFQQFFLKKSKKKNMTKNCPVTQLPKGLSFISANSSFSRLLRLLWKRQFSLRRNTHASIK